MNFIPSFLRTKYEALSKRNRFFLLAGGFISLLALLYFLGLQPLTAENARLENAIDRAYLDLNWMKQASQKITPSDSRKAAANDNVSLASMVSVVMSKYGLEVKIAASGGNSLKMSAKETNFVKLQEALFELENSGVLIEKADIRRGEVSGTADFTVALTK